MNVNIWDIIDEAREKTNGDIDDQASYMIGQLQNLSSDLLFQLIIDFEERLLEGNTLEMMQVGYLVNGYCFEEELEYFLSYLIAGGKDFWDQALANPDHFLSNNLEDRPFPMAYRSKSFREVFVEAYYLKINVTPGENEDIDVALTETLHEKVWEKHPWFDNVVAHPIIDLEGVFPLLYSRFWKRAHGDQKVYKKYGGMGDEGTIRLGKIWQLYIDAPYAPFGWTKDRLRAYIPPFVIVKDFFKSGGGGDAGMSPGIGWNPFELTVDQYLEMIDRLLSINTINEKGKYFYCPREIRIDLELNNEFPDESEWRENFVAKYHSR